MLLESPNYFEKSIVLKLFGLPAKLAVRNKQQLGWFLKPRSQISSIFHFQGFSNILQNHYFICLNQPTEFVHIFQQVSLSRGCKGVRASYKLSPIQHSQRPPRSQPIKNQQHGSVQVLHNYQPLVLVNHICVFTKTTFHVTTSSRHKGHHCWYFKTHFYGITLLKFYLKYFSKYASEITLT